MASWAIVSTPNTGSAFINDGICLGPDTFIFVGTAGTVLKSTDGGQTWALKTAAASNTWTAIAYNGTRLVAVSSDGANRVMYSDDEGETWTSASAAAANDWSSVVWAPSASKFVAVAPAASNQVMHSADGVTWTGVTVTSAAWLAVTASDTLIVAFANGSPNHSMTSTDGATWTDRTGPSTLQCSFGAGRFVITYNASLSRFGVGGWLAPDNTDTQFGYSADGNTWTVVDVGTTNLLGMAGHCATPALGGFIGFIPYDNVGNPTNTLLVQSTDSGATWTTVDTSQSGLWAGACAWDDDHGTFVVWDENLTNSMLVGTFSLAALSSVSPVTGSTNGGTLLTLTGTGLGSVAQGDVLVGGVVALAVTPNGAGTQVTCLAPAHASGPVDVTITGIGTLTNGYTYVGLDRVSPSSGTFAGGQTVVLTGYGFALGIITGSPTFGGTAVTSYIINSNTQITVVTPAHGSGLVAVIVPGVDTLTNGYEYTLQDPRIPPIPYRTPLIENANGVMRQPWVQWLQAFAQQTNASPLVPAENVIGVLSVDNIPTLPWTKIDTAGSSLADLTTRSASDLTSGTLRAARGGTGFSEYAIGDLLYADGTYSLAKLADVAAGSYLRSGGVDTAPVWSTLTLPNAANAGDILFATGADSYASQAPAALTTVDDTNVTLALGGTPATSLVKAVSLTLGWTGTLALTRGGLGADQSAIAKGGLFVGTAAATVGIKAVGTDGFVLTADAASAGGVKWAAVAGGGAALTKTDDANVTLTLGGSPTTALLAATSLTLGWTGQLAASRGGTAIDTSGSTGVAQVSGGTWSVGTTLQSAVQDNITRLGILTNGLHVVGSTTDSSADAVKVTDSAAANLLSIRNDGKATWGTVLSPISSDYVNYFYGSGTAASNMGVFQRNDPGEVRLSLVSSGVQGAGTPGTFAYPTYYAISSNMVLVAGSPTYAPMASGAFIGAFAIRGTRNSSGSYNAQTNIGLTYFANEAWSDSANGTKIRLTGVITGTTTQYTPYESESVNGNVFSGATADSSTYALQAKNSTSTLFAVRSDGKVGIGTASPSQLFEVLGVNTFISSKQNGGTTGHGLLLRGVTDAYVGQASGANGLIIGAVAGDIILRTAAGKNILLSVDGGASALVSVSASTVTVQAAVLSGHATGGIGYTTGAGGSVTQATSKATAFTLSKVAGKITTANDALAADTSVSSTWTNTAIAATDVVLVTHLSGGTVGAYAFNVACGAGSATLTITNRSTGSLSEALVLSFVVLKGVTS